MSGGVSKSNFESLLPGRFGDPPLLSDAETESAVRDSLGRKVAAVRMVDYYEDRPEPPLDGNLVFTFRDGLPLLLTTSHDDAVSAYAGPFHWEAATARVRDGRQEVSLRELSAAAPWSSIVGARLVSVSVLIKPRVGRGPDGSELQWGCVSGLLFAFSSGGRVGYQNWTYGEHGASFNPCGGVWSEGLLVEWLRWI